MGCQLAKGEPATGPTNQNNKNRRSQGKESFGAVLDISINKQDMCANI